MQTSLITVLASKERTGGSYSLLHEHAPHGGGPASHTQEQDEAIYLLDGALTMTAGSERFQAERGASLYVLAGSAQRLQVESMEAKLLQWYLPEGTKN